ncbi:MAG: response regulator [Caulobacteraceae bacterium]
MDEARRLRVFVVEDEMMVAMLIEDMLDDMGHELAGLATHLEAALVQASCVQTDVAVLDINLNGKLSFPIADILRERGVPFFFASGYGSAGLCDAYKGTLTLKKPFQAGDLTTALAKISGSSMGVCHA